MSEPLNLDGMPPPVDDRYEYWGEQPLELSPRCMWWLRWFADNPYLTSDQLQSLDIPCGNYEDYTQKFGVYMWEWHHVLYHVYWNVRAERKDRDERPKLDLSKVSFPTRPDTPIRGLDDVPPGAKAGAWELKGRWAQAGD